MRAHARKLGARVSFFQSNHEGAIVDELHRLRKWADAIVINPAVRTSPVGDKFTYSAQAIYSDGTSNTVTGLATWLSSNASIAQVSNAFGSKGQTTCLSLGAVTITATYGGVTGSASLTVSSATLTAIQVAPLTTSVAVGVPVIERADAIYSDGTSIDVTGFSTFTSTDPSVASVSDAPGSKGRATTIKAGSTSIHAVYGGLTGSASLTVTTAKLTTIQLFPFKPNLPIGYGVNLTATALYDDGSTVSVTGFATFTSSNTAVAAVSDAFGSKGHVTPITAGTATISASWNGVTGTDVITVTTASLTSIAVSPNPTNIGVLSNAQSTATGTFSDGTTLDVTNYVAWTSSDPSVTDVSNVTGTKGRVYGFKSGSVVVSALRSGVVGSGNVSVK
ncbi:MAG: hypothetical protein NVS3B20_06280 [Polyangiales bacterium]